MEQRLKRIKAFVFDIDGVFTDGTLIPLADGDLLRKFNAKDSFSVRYAGEKGFIIGIISGGDSKALEVRCRNLGIKPENIHLKSRGKLSVFHKFCKDNCLKPEEVAYIGDDIPDIQVLSACGLGIAPADAVDEAKEAAFMVSDHPGGNLCIRKSVEMVMKAQGKWHFDKDHFDLIY